MLALSLRTRASLTCPKSASMRQLIPLRRPVDEPGRQQTADRFSSAMRRPRVRIIRRYRRAEVVPAAAHGLAKNYSSSSRRLRHQIPASGTRRCPHPVPPQDCRPRSRFADPLTILVGVQNVGRIWLPQELPSRPWGIHLSAFLLAFAFQGWLEHAHRGDLVLQLRLLVLAVETSYQSGCG